MYLLSKKTSILVASTKMLGIKTKRSFCFENGMYVKTSRTAEITAAPYCYWDHRGKMFL